MRRPARIDLIGQRIAQPANAGDHAAVVRQLDVSQRG